MPVDPGPRRSGRASTCNEQVAGVQPRHAGAAAALRGSRLSTRASARSCSCSGRRSPASDADDQRLFVGGAAELLERAAVGGLRGLPQPARRARAARGAPRGARRRARAAARRSSASAPSSAHPGLRDVALVGASYGVVNRTLGAVSLLGPLRMDYDDRDPVASAPPRPSSRASRESSTPTTERRRLRLR